MTTPNERLRQIRERKYPTAREAAKAMGVAEATYIQHENGTRGSGSIPRPAAERYAAFYRISLDWLLKGKGDEPELDPEPSEAELEQMLREIVDDEVTFQTRPADLPRIFAPALHEYLARFRSDRARHGTPDAKHVPGEGAQSPAPTKQSAPATRRNA